MSDKFSLTVIEILGQCAECGCVLTSVDDDEGKIIWTNGVNGELIPHCLDEVKL